MFRLVPILFCVWLASVSQAQLIPTNVVPAAHLIDFTPAGIPGGIPVVTNIFTNLSSGASAASISNAVIAAGAAGSQNDIKVVLLGSGDYTNSGGIPVASFAILRGTNATMHLTGGGYGGGDTEAGMGIYFGTSMFANRTGGSPGGTAYNVSSGYTKGAQSVVLASPPGAVTGYLMTFDQLNDTNYGVTLVGQYGTSTASGRDSGARAMGQTVEITNVSGSTVYFHPPLYHELTSGLDPEAVIWNPQVQWAGVENITFKCYSNLLGMVYGIGSSKYIWVKDCEDDFADRDHGRIGSSFGIEIRGSYFHDSYVHGSGSFDNPWMIQEKSSCVLITDNIFTRTHTPVMINSGSSGNVVIYNFLADPYDTGSTNVQMYEINMNHRAHPSYNLVEGNVTGQIRPDRSWGSSSAGMIAFNYVTASAYIEPPYNARGALQDGHWANQALRGISIDSAQYYYNLIGNIVVPRHTPSGGVAFRTIKPDSSPTYNDHATLFVFGESDVAGSTYPDGTCFTNSVNYGNYDSVNAAQMWISGNTNRAMPPSFFYTSKPSNFGSLNWPPFDPSNPPADYDAAVLRIPAGYRYVTGTNPPAADSSPPRKLKIKRVDA